MTIKVPPKQIKEMCGSVSFRKGDSFHRDNKVTIKNYNSNYCEAIVSGTEEFHVVIKKNDSGTIQTTCSCPKLASFQKDCQHIAAVLLAMYGMENNQLEDSLTEDLLTLFNHQPAPKSGAQLHFEKRQIINVEFTCKTILVGENKWMFGIGVKIGQIAIKNLCDFLSKVKDGKSSPALGYDPTIQCFHRETDRIIHELIKIQINEKVYKDEKHSGNQHFLLIPPTAWEILFPLLERAPSVKLVDDSNVYEGLCVVNNEPLLIQFHLSEVTSKDFQLKINGLKHLKVMTLYNTVLSDGKIIQLKSDDCKRLADLKEMLHTSGTNKIPIKRDQLNFFLEKVVPGLKKIGDVHISTEVIEGFLKTPLKAKLFLDRVNNRLLAGLEFHYDNVTINPLEDNTQSLNSMVFRDAAKEDAILALMEEGRFTRTDGGFFLHNEELEYEFLYHIVPSLEKLVQIYATTAVKIRIFKGNAPPQIKIKAKKDRMNWLEFKFEMDSIPENEIREILAALEEKRKYYRLRNGSLLSLETKEFEEMKQFLTAVPTKNVDLEKGLNMPVIQGLQLLDTVDESSRIFSLEKSFQNLMNSLQNPRSQEFFVPNGFELILRDYQKQGFQWLKTLASFKFGGILADDMGLGKTLQSITFIVSELDEIRNRKLPVLIVSPSSITYNWRNELNKFAPNVNAVIMDGNRKERNEKLKSVVGKDVVIISYPLLRRDISSFEKQAFHTVFFDEAQAFKNPFTQTARAVKRIQAEYRFALTGTPMENSRDELWSIFHVVFPELFQGLKEFNNLSRKAIVKRTRPFLLRRVKEDVLLELPEKIELVDRQDLLPEQKKLYAAYLAKLKHETLKHLDKNTLRKNRIKILAGLTRLRQICCHPSLFVDGYKGSSAKFNQLLKIIEEAQLSGRRVLIFSQFTKMLNLIGRELATQGRRYFYLDGQTPSEERVEICHRFNQGERDLFLISLKAGGTGLNLTGADTVILYDLWWNPAVEEQAADRAHRIGQTNTVQVIKLIAKGTIEEKINELQEKKKHLIEEIINHDDNVSSILTDEDIREILMI